MCLYVAVAKVRSEEFLTFVIKDAEQAFFCICFFAAKCDRKYDRIQAQSATLPTGETTYQFHGCKTVKNPNEEMQMMSTDMVLGDFMMNKMIKDH